MISISRYNNGRRRIPTNNNYNHKRTRYTLYAQGGQCYYDGSQFVGLLFIIIILLKHFIFFMFLINNAPIIIMTNSIIFLFSRRPRFADPRQRIIRKYPSTRLRKLKQSNMQFYRTISTLNCQHTNKRDVVANQCTYYTDIILQVVVSAQSVINREQICKAYFIFLC